MKGKAKSIVDHVAPGPTAINKVMAILDEEFNSSYTVVRQCREKLEGQEAVKTYCYESPSNFATIVKSVATTLRRYDCPGDLSSVGMMQMALSKL